MAVSKFQNRYRRGSPVYACRICKHNTRETGEGEESVELCAACYELAGIENSMNDDGIAEALSWAPPRVLARIAEIEKRGKGSADWREVFAELLAKAK